MASNLGGAMHDAAGGWMMTTLTPEPLLVALMQTASSLPLFVPPKAARARHGGAMLRMDGPARAPAIVSRAP